MECPFAARDDVVMAIAAPIVHAVEESPRAFAICARPRQLHFKKIMLANLLLRFEALGQERIAARIRKGGSTLSEIRSNM